MTDAGYDSLGQELVRRYFFLFLVCRRQSGAVLMAGMFFSSGPEVPEKVAGCGLRRLRQQGGVQLPAADGRAFPLRPLPGASAPRRCRLDRGGVARLQASR